MIKKIDNFLNSLTMYRVVLYGLLAIGIFALILSFLGIISFTPLSLLFSFILLLATCYVTNFLFAKLFHAFTNSESYFITALILFLIMLPPTNIADITSLILAGTLAMASKYLLAINKKHIFNPAAISIFILGIAGNSNVFWWIGSKEFLPIIAIVGLLIVRKIRRFHLFFSFLITSLAILTFSNIPLIEIFSSWPILFFGTVMLTEPLTSPPSKNRQMFYGALVGILFSTQIHIGPIYSTPEFALIIGNIASFIISPKEKLFLKLRESKKIGDDIYEFVFDLKQKLNFKPGQYLEWTLPHSPVDSRGNRRYFTIASSPTEDELKIGIKIGPKKSSFKKALLENNKAMISASSLAGEFTMPQDTNKKLAFLAGGIGVTPFWSMIKYLIDKNEKRDIVLFYFSKTKGEFVYEDLWQEARKKINLKIIYVETDKDGYITADLIKANVTDYKTRIFYISGPNAMVENYKAILQRLNIKQIVTDYFPGY